MPSNKGRNTLSRQWELLKMLPTSGSGVTAKALQIRLAEAGFSTTKRTIERDLEDLARVFAIRRNDKSVPYGFSWAPPTSVNLSAVSVYEALTLQLVQETLRPLVPSSMLAALKPRIEQASSKLKALAGNSPVASWPTKVASVPANLPLLPPTIDPAVLSCVQQALLEEQAFSCRYYSAHRDRSSELVLTPLGLVQRGAITYLIAVASPHSDIRQFALHRISHLELLGQPSEPPEGFDLQAYVASGAMQFGGNAVRNITLEAWVSDGLLRLLRETPLSENMETMSADDGGWIRASVPDSWELERWLLSHTGSIAVTAPEDLKQRLILRLRNGLGLYDE
ncbi:WYL domain-containing protein [Pseudomonas nitroreducens]|uniref:helix-turn-helix transcriptional regulator n=1 Tax=Pseudomonas nitroreducens TaxID=46680 RepID=UPI00244C52AC|nr:WYL domain-containing protein [Pseudomonas nitroreducens]MDG9856980.1 WYL domain-containing protein [Pseudomonas nitroreducens]MDH1075762.1 WYL domain-containing protein [Pseudomonas nitroreducens]